MQDFVLNAGKKNHNSNSILLKIITKTRKNVMPKADSPLAEKHEKDLSIKILLSTGILRD